MKSSSGGSGGSGGDRGSSAGGAAGSSSGGAGGSSAASNGGAGGSSGSGKKFDPTKPPCDIYKEDGGPCVSAHSTIRRLSSEYNGPLYQVRRPSDSTTQDIGFDAAGYAKAADQDTFCGDEVCLISKIYDQSGKKNDLTKAPAGEAKKTPDNEAKAKALPLKVGGRDVYGVHIQAGIGYRNNQATGLATGDNAQTAYMVVQGDYYNGGCCFDYGNAETNSKDNGEGTMEAVYFGNCVIWGKGDGKGPWVMGDLENGLWAGDANVFTDAKPVTFKYVTGMVKGDAAGRNHWSIKVGDAQAGGLSTQFDGKRPSDRYNPMRKEGALILGTGGDNSNADQGNFFEGLLTAHYSSKEADDAVQANIVSVGYGSATATGAGGGSGSGGSGSGGAAAGGASGAGGAGGGGGTTSGGSSVTSLSGTKTIGTLSATEATQLCKDTFGYFGTSITRATGCKWKGIAFAASSSAPTEAIMRENCTGQESSCKSAASGPYSADNASCSDLPASCKATVADYSACIVDEVKVFNQSVDGFPTCDALTKTNMTPILDYQSGGNTPASCTSLIDKCPDLYTPTPVN